MRRRDKRRRLKKASAGNNTSLDGKTAAARESREIRGTPTTTRSHDAPDRASQASSPADQGRISKVRDPRLR